MANAITTNRFERAHGSKPKGRGLWCFEIVQSGERFWTTGSLTEAKREALAWAREDGNDYAEIAVMP